jgi:hypothetical protein
VFVQPMQRICDEQIVPVLFHGTILGADPADTTRFLRKNEVFSILG